MLISTARPQSPVCILQCGCVDFAFVMSIEIELPRPCYVCFTNKSSYAFFLNHAYDSNAAAVGATSYRVAWSTRFCGFVFCHKSCPKNWKDILLIDYFLEPITNTKHCGCLPFAIIDVLPHVAERWRAVIKTAAMLPCKRHRFLLL